MADDNSPNSVTQWIEGLKQRDDSFAAQKIWDRYREQLIRFANRKFEHSRKRMEDEDDAVIIAYHQFLKLVDSERYSKLNDRNDLWQILAMLTERRVRDIQRRESAEKNGGGNHQGNNKLVGESALDPTATEQPNGLARFETQQPSPAFCSEYWDEFENCLELLGDETLVRIAIAKMSNESNEAIADQCGIGISTVGRKLSKIAKLWRQRHA